MIIANAGDPMIPLVAGMLSSASEITNVILAGGYTDDCSTCFSRDNWL